MNVLSSSFLSWIRKKLKSTLRNTARVGKIEVHAAIWIWRLRMALKRLQCLFYRAGAGCVLPELFCKHRFRNPTMRDASRHYKIWWKALTMSTCSFIILLRKSFHEVYVRFSGSTLPWLTWFTWPLIYLSVILVFKKSLVTESRKTSNTILTYTRKFNHLSLKFVIWKTDSSSARIQNTHSSDITQPLEKKYLIMRWGDEMKETLIMNQWMCVNRMKWN